MVERLLARNDSESGVRNAILDGIEESSRVIQRLVEPNDDLVKRTLLVADEPVGAALRAVSKDQMVELTSSGGGTDVPDPAIEVFVDDISGRIACARTVCVDFVDYMQLVRMPNGWKIAHILFRNAD